MFQKNNMKRDFFWNTLGTTLNAFNSLFFLIIVTRINKIDNAGIFSFAFSTACLFFVVGIYCGRVFQVTDNDSDNDITYLNVHIISIAIMIASSLIFCLLRGYDLYKIAVIVLLVVFKATEAFCDTFHAIIQKNNELYKVGISLTVRSLICLLLFLIVDCLTNNLIIAIISIIIVNLCVLVFYDIKNAKLNIVNNYHFDRGKVFKIFKSGFFVFAFTFLNLFLINISKYAIDFYSVDKVQTIYGIILMPATVVSLVAQFIIHPFLLEIKNSINSKKINKLNNILVRLCLFVFLFTIVCIICAWFFGIPVLKFVYGINLNNYKIDLIIILIGAMFYAISTIFSNVLISFRKTISQTVIYFIVSIISIAISFLLVKTFNINGAVYSYLITMFMIFILFLILITVVIKKESRCSN